MLRRIKRYLRYEYLLFMRLRGNPKQIARGVAVGVAINFLPTVGTGVFVAYILAGLLRTNRTATLLSTLAVKAGVPLYYALNIVVGDFLLGYEDEGFWALTKYTFDWKTIKQMGISFLVGGVINSAVVALVCYYIMLYSVKRYRNRRMKSIQE